MNTRKQKKNNKREQSTREKTAGNQAVMTVNLSRIDDGLSSD
jgi:hypothetical protein